MKKVYWLGCMALMLFPFTISAWAADDEPLGSASLAEEKSPPYRLPEYWLGVKLRIDEKGIIVQEVVPDSPAAKAGFAQNDVLVKVNDKKISDVSDVLQAVEAAKDKEMKLEIIRDGQSKTIAVTPAKRPEEARIPVPPPESDIEAFRKWIEQVAPGGGFGQQGPMQFRFFRPGVILPRGAPVHPPLPENMSISITKTGDKPADIVVKMGDEKWEVSEKELDKLPEKVRPYVDRMLGLATSSGAGAVRWIPEMSPSPFWSPEPEASGNVPPGNLERRIEKRLDDMMRHIEKLENELHMRHQDAKMPEPPQTPENNKEEGPQGKTGL
ncbi:MAG: PDZ domain-containing protein [Thermoguttaceae bacterium]|jgi:membrane-associated protease RseP (regulator of RpoE activity)